MVVNLSRQHSGLYQYSVCEGPAPVLRARLTVHPAAPPKHPGLGIFFFLSSDLPPRGEGGRTALERAR